ncbi:MAG: hypothetical protein GF381_04565 [Candidatus Pacebacteria bacterium]|nr:hypothetical protein [Candidatus Paceibacterota bacterium]
MISYLNHKINLNQIYLKIKKHWLLALLLVVIIITRLPIFLSGVVPFTFDHGKDSLAVLDMMLNLDLKLIGPWTSIPGLYFGPAWYYLLLSAYWLGQANPIAPVVLMTLLLMVQVVIAYRFLGRLYALVFGFAPIAWTISTSAWNPFPMTLISLLILVIFNQLKDQKQTRWQQILTLGLAAGFGFHFSSAFAVFMPVLILVSLWLLKVKLSWQKLFVFGLGLLIPFLPQLVFELKHSFGQTKAVLSYFSQGQAVSPSLAELRWMIGQYLTELLVYTLPTPWLPISELMNLVKYSVLGLTALFVSRRWHLEKSKPSLNVLTLISLIWITVPFFGFIFLHFNLWYLLAMAPWAIYIFVRLLWQTPRSWRLVVVFLFLITPITSAFRFELIDRHQLALKRDFLPSKIEALAWIDQQAAGQSFSSYHYVPHIYDYSYQYLYYQRALSNKPLPVEFSYQPNETNYVQQKAVLQSYFSKRDLVQEALPQHIFFIVEKAENQDYLDQWWGRQQFGQIIKSKQVSSELQVFMATPK